MSTKLHFTPWKGHHFDVPNSQRLLLLGESHYVNEVETKESDFTIQMIEHVIKHGDEKTNYFRTIVELMGHKDRSGFWNEVAFGNLFQRGFTNSWKQPTQADY